MKKEGLVEGSAKIYRGKDALDFLEGKGYNKVNKVNKDKLYEYAEQAKQQGKLTDSEFDSITEGFRRQNGGSNEQSTSERIGAKGVIHDIKSTGVTPVTPAKAEKILGRKIPKENICGTCYDEVYKYSSLSAVTGLSIIASRCRRKSAFIPEEQSRSIARLRAA